jgi:hypothetical protein
MEELDEIRLYAEDLKSRDAATLLDRRHPAPGTALYQRVGLGSVPPYYLTLTTATDH